MTCDLQRIKRHLVCSHCQDYGALEVTMGELKDLFNRLEASEVALMSCKRYQSDDGLVIVEEPKVELYEAWRKEAGK